MATMDIVLEVTRVDQTGEIKQIKFDEEVPSGFLDKMPRIDFRRHKGDMRVKLTIKDDTQNNLVFSNDPFWIVEGDQCPTVSAGIKNITAIRDAHNAKVLIVDVGSKAPRSEYTFRLNFKNGQTQTGNFWLDPKILNGGSPPIVKREDRVLAPIVVGLIGAAVGALLTLAAIRLELF